MASSELIKTFSDCGGLLEGHFGLTSGRHSSIYLQCALVLQYPDIARRIGIQLADLARETFTSAGQGEIDTVISPAVGGIVIGQEVASGLGTRAIFSERVDGRMELRRGFTIGEGERILAVEDVVTTGGSIRETVELASACGGTIVGTASLVHRFTEEPIDPTDFPHLSLLPVHAPAYDPSDCPMCREGKPLEKPGSRHLSAPKAL
jgi:orotate phosphoribosyltransferase